MDAHGAPESKIQMHAHEECLKQPGGGTIPSD